MEISQKDWEEVYPNYWVHKESNWVVRDYWRPGIFEGEGEYVEGWVILDDRGMMISSECSDSITGCMSEVEDLLEESEIL